MLKYDNCKDCKSQCKHAGKDREFICINGISCKEVYTPDRMKKAVTSVFDEIIQELATITNTKETEEELLHIQEVQVHIIKAHNEGYLNHYEYKALNLSASLIRDNIHSVLRG